MADKKISELTVATGIADADLMPIVQGGVTKQITLAELYADIPNSPAVTSRSGTYGDGSDGDVTILINTSLVRDMYYNNLTIDDSVTLNPNGFRIFVRNTLTFVSATARIARDGTNSAGTGGGAALAAGTLGASAVGGAGGVAAGSAGGSLTTCSGGAGGTGGSGSGGGGGAAGAATLPTAILGGTEVLRALPYAVAAKNNTLATSHTAGCGGGGGGGDGTAGGGGGGGGGAIVVSARVIVGSGVISAMGGNGFSPVAGNRGGGGGGGGGLVVVVSASTPDTFTVDVSGGQPGNGFGTGASGNAGASGNYFKLVH